MRDVRPLLCGLALLVPLASCDRRPGAAESKTLRFINRGDIFTLDLNDMSYGQDFRVTYLFREGLYAPTGPEQTPVPAGATGCDVSADQTVYTFRLRPEAVWSNGDAVTSADYVFSWRHMLESPGEYTYLFYYVRGAEQYKNDFAAGKRPSFNTVGIEAPDRLTLRVTLNAPVSYWLDLMAFPPFYPRNERSMDKFVERDPATGKPILDPTTGGVTYATTYTRPPDVACNGAFVLSDWQFKRRLRFTKNPTYWDRDHVKLDQVDMVVNDNVLSEYLQFAAGAVDWVVEVPPELAPELRNKHEPGLQTSPSFTTAYLALACGPTLPGGVKNPMSDVRVRQAMAMAVDKSFITDQITRMGEAVATTFVPPGTLPGYTSLPGLPHDAAAAKRLLAEAGYPDGRGFPRLSILYNAENGTRARLAQNLKSQWKQTLGIDTEVESVEGKIFHQRVNAKDFQICTVSWTGDYPDVSTFTDKYLSDSLQNDSAWQNPQYDRLLARAVAEPDRAKRFEELRQAEHLLNTEVPIVPLYHYVNAALIGPRAQGISLNPRQLTDWKNVSVTGTAETAQGAATP